MKRPSPHQRLTDRNEIIDRHDAPSGPGRVLRSSALVPIVHLAFQYDVSAARDGYTNSDCIEHAEV